MEEYVNESELGIIDGEYSDLKETEYRHHINLNVKVPRSVSNSVKSLVSEYRTETGVIITNLLAYNLGVSVLYSRNTKTIPPRYNRKKLKTLNIIKAVEHLEAEGYVQNCVAKRHFNTPYTKESSYITATKKLFDVFSSKESIEKSAKTVVEDRECIILKDDKGNKVSYKDTPVSLYSRGALTQYNLFASTVNVEDEGTRLSTTLDMHFKNTFEDYGRLFGASYQNISKQRRKLITIDGQECVELDFKCMQFYMLLDMYLLSHKVEHIDDLYEYCLTESQKKNPENRTLVKMAFSMMVNCGKRGSAIKALQGHMNMNGNESDFKNAPDVFEALEASYEFLFSNPAVMANIYCGKPLAAVLQRRESAICLEVASTLAESGTYVATIHDSYLCKRSDYPLVSKLVGDTYRLHMRTDRKLKISLIDGGTMIDTVV